MGLLHGGHGASCKRRGLAATGLCGITRRTMRLPQSHDLRGHGPRPPVVPHPRYWPVTAWLIVANVIVLIVNGLWVNDAYRFSRPLMHFGAFTIEDALYRGQVWRLITASFLHDGMGHLLMNMLGLFFFGLYVERYLGRPLFLLFYLLCGVAGDVLFALLVFAGWLGYTAQTAGVGASGCVFGVVAGCATIAPHMSVRLILPPVTLTMRQIAWIYIGIAAIAVIAYGRTGEENAGGQAVHLGGAVAGWLLLRYPGWIGYLREKGADFRFKIRRLRGPKMRIRY